MTGKRRQSNTGGGWPLALAKHMGLGIGGAMAGMMAAVYLIDTGLTFLNPPVMAAVFMLVGGVAAFLGASIEPLCGAIARVQSTVGGVTTRTADSADMPSAVGTLLAASSAFVAAWLVILQEPAKVALAVMIGFWWLFGVTAQASAGILARLRAVDPELV